jgi:MarR family transcriptional regulator for hemolysin
MSNTKDDVELSRLLLQEIPSMMRVIRSMVRTLDQPLTVPQFRVLNHLSRQACTSKQLADSHGVSVPAMSRMVNLLAGRKLLLRTPDKFDRRQVQLRPSKKGLAELERIRKLVRTKVAERMQVLTPEKKHSLAAGLAVLQELSRENH